MESLPLPRRVVVEKAGKPVRKSKFTEHPFRLPDGRLIVARRWHRSRRRLDYEGWQISHEDSEPTWAEFGYRFEWSVRRCPECGGWFATGFGHARCSPRCDRVAARAQLKAHRARRRAERQPTMRLCLHCQHPFAPANPKGRYCSTHCRVKAHRFRKWNQSIQDQIVALKPSWAHRGPS
jgi:hypothetical protein